MQKKKFSIRTVALAGMCAALSVVLGKLLQIPVGDSVRISFENLPILLASLILGPFFGGLVGVTADLVGCAIMGYTVNPFITLGACLVGVLPALLSRAFLKLCGFLSVFLPVLLTHAAANMLVKSVGLYLYFQTPPAFLMLRVLVSLISAVLESVILYELFRTPLFGSLRQGGAR